uniref:Fibronectin type III domain-containing protein n=1 Tax=Candidatus Kentrum sp. LFY TaxID=2126342 RepID=A0A450V4F6_9GAMM|nr:MAG: Fibronectin type III domain-containing protein [Candidatus Kentron sp. LFY]
MKFPRKESDILSLAQEMVTGFDAHTDIYPEPLVGTADLRANVDAYHTARGAEMTARAAWEKTVTAKNEVLQTLAENMKRDIRYAENIVDFDDAQLRLIGWGGRKPRQSLPPPGQVRSLDIAAQGDGAITLDWKAPNEGGTIAAYRVERLDPHADETDWEEVGTTTGLETTIAKQERGKKFEFRVLAFNKAGTGEASNTVAAML